MESMPNFRLKELRKARGHYAAEAGNGSEYVAKHNQPV